MKKRMFFLLFLFLFLLKNLEAVDINLLLQETQKSSHKPDSVRLVWWIPIEYWEAIFSQSPDIQEKQKSEFLKALEPYLLIVIVDGKIGSFGTITYQSEQELRGKLKIEYVGKTYTPLPANKIDSKTKNLLSIMKPILVNIIGPLGENMHFYLFSSKDEQGSKIADPLKEGRLKVMLDEEALLFRLPLGALLPQRVCLICNEKYPGNYKYCPFDGILLK